MDGDAFVFEDRLDGGGGVLVLAPGQPRRLFDHSDLGAETAEHLREFERDVAAADDDEMAGQHIEIHHRGIGEIGDVLDAGKVGHRGAPAGVEEDLWRGQKLVADAHGIGGFEAGVAAIKRAALHPGDPAFEIAAGVVRHLVLARLDLLVVDADRAGERHAIIGGAAGKMRGIGARHHRLGRHAAGVDAGAADELALDQRDAHAGGLEPADERRAGLAGADDDGVEGLRAHATAATMSRPPMIATASSMKAAGGSLPKPAASLERASAPPSVPMTAPMAPAIRPPMVAPAVAPITAPEKAPVTMRAPNCCGTLRLGVDGNWSVMSSTSARMVKMPTAIQWPMKPAQVPASGNQPSQAPQATVAGAVVARRPAITPISNARM